MFSVLKKDYYSVNTNISLSPVRNQMFRVTAREDQSTSKAGVQDSIMLEPRYCSPDPRAAHYSSAAS